MTRRTTAPIATTFTNPRQRNCPGAVPIVRFNHAWKKKKEKKSDARAPLSQQKSVSLPNVYKHRIILCMHPTPPLIPQQ